MTDGPFNMDLGEFISKTLISIKEGIKDANSHANNSFYISTATHVVNFNVAVEVGKENTSEKGGGLKIHVVEGKMGGSSKSSESNISRIDFTVGVKTTIQ